MDAIEELSELIGGLLDAPLPDSDEGLCDLLVGLHEAQTRLGALKVKALAAAQRRRAYAGDGSKTVSGWLARRCKASQSVIRGEARLGERLLVMPLTDMALSAADIGEDKAVLLSKSADSPRAIVKEAFARDEEMLVGIARELHFPEFVRAMAYWENAVDPDGAEDDADRAFDRRRVQLSRVGGEFHLKGRFDLVQGTELETALERVFKELLGEDRAAAREANGGDDVPDGELGRTFPQRRADALVELARRGSAMPEGAQKPKPLVTVVVGLESLTGPVRELFNKTPVTPGQIARTLDEAEVERAVFAGKNRIIELGERTRFFTGGLRRAIEIRDRYCQHPGCFEPAEWCEADHIQPHGWGGLTSQTNGRMLCGYHNRWRVSGGKPDPEPKSLRRGCRAAHLEGQRELAGSASIDPVMGEV